MTPKKIQAALIALSTEVGPKADVTMYIADVPGESPIHVGLYPYGILKGEGYLSVESDDFGDALEKMRAAWDAYKDQHRAEITKRMALAIIRLTNELGECTDAALRDEFDAGQVASYGADACALADTMAAKGPFSIVTVRGANAAGAAA